MAMLWDRLQRALNASVGNDLFRAGRGASHPLGSIEPATPPAPQDLWGGLGFYQPPTQASPGYDPGGPADRNLTLPVRRTDVAPQYWDLPAGGETRAIKTPLDASESGEGHATNPMILRHGLGGADLRALQFSPAAQNGFGPAPADLHISRLSEPSPGRPDATATDPDSAFIDRRPWSGDDNVQLIPVGNPANRRLKREWARKKGQPWPKDPVTGRDYDVAHKKAIADGGANTLENIHPLHPDAHRLEHMSNGDFARWARRQAIARAYGGRVVRGLGIFSILPDITGILSGRIRTDTFDNFMSDMVGAPSQEDLRQPLEASQDGKTPGGRSGSRFA